MSDRNKALELEDERTAEKRYAKVLQEDANRRPVFNGPRNAPRIANGRPPVRPVANGELVGRVALVGPDEDGESDFYIGERYAKLDGVNVYGWAAPIACTFFRGSDHHASCNDVAVVRAFRRANGQIVDFVDEQLRNDAPIAPFKKRGLSIPAPRTRPNLPAVHPPEPTTESIPPFDEAASIVDSTRPNRQLDLGNKPATKQDTLPSIRAEELLRLQMLAPRKSYLAPVLATLQPDQYELVALPAMESVVIDGQPGTGKTIVATHRAAYLVNDETPPENALDGDVLIVGPTTGYSNHVRDAISRLAGPTSRIKILSLPELADKLIGKQTSPHAGASRSYHDVGWELAKFVRSAIAKLKAVRSVTPVPEQVFEYMRTNAGLITRDGDWQVYLRKLPPFRQALTYRVHAPLIAFIKWETAKPADLRSIEHVIVDEAQDVTPLEWLLLDEINEADAWTILGDLNQRRSDHTLASWTQVLEVIAIDPATPTRRMQRGYRSTKPILEFANRLLPRNQRRLHAFQQSGPEPVVLKVDRKSLAEHVVREIERLSGAYPDGRLAVICVSPDTVTTALRRKGWESSTREPHLWRKDRHKVVVANPDAMRGLEFDAVVVAEPHELPQNFGRHGPLYTALTRANRELSIVHSGPLPEQLRRK